VARKWNTTGFANLQWWSDAAGPGWQAVAGDWDGDGLADTGLYDPLEATFRLPGGTVVPYGTGGIGPVPVAGRWQ
jgi:hypothetical protein